VGLFASEVFGLMQTLGSFLLLRLKQPVSNEPKKFVDVFQRVTLESVGGLKPLHDRVKSGVVLGLGIFELKPRFLRLVRTKRFPHIQVVHCVSLLVVPTAVFRGEGEIVSPRSLRFPDRIDGVQVSLLQLGVQVFDLPDVDREWMNVHVQNSGMIERVNGDDLSEHVFNFLIFAIGRNEFAQS
jgi:hypothetical protein